MTTEHNSYYRWLPQSFRTRLFVAFMIVIGIASMLVAHNVISTLNINQLRSSSEQLLRTRILTSELLDGDRNFISSNNLDLDFYGTGRSQYFSIRDSLMLAINAQLDSIEFYLNDQHSASFTFNLARESLREYEILFSKLIQTQLIRGFKDHGLEGKMRAYAHQLEKSARICSRADILMLRRHEKDFFLRSDESYITKLNDLATEMITACKRHPSGSLEAELLAQYQIAFNSIAEKEMEIGPNTSFGLKHELHLSGQQASMELESLFERVDSFMASTQRHSLRINLLILALGLTAALLIAYLLSNSVSRPIEKISSAMEVFDLREEHLELPPPEISSLNKSTEVQILIAAYTSMTEHIMKQLHEINAQKSKLEKQNYELMDLNHELDRFAYSVSHDLRSPIASILGLINLAKMENPEVALDQFYLPHMAECVTKLDSMILKLLDYSRNKNGEISFTRCTIRELIDEISKSHLLHLRSDVSIRVFEDQSTFLTDRDRMITAIQNIISNSIRFKHPEREQVEIKIERLSHGASNHIRITDNAQGIPTHIMPRIFEMFYRGKNSDEGTGLGLFIVKRIVDRLGGKVKVFSELNVGSTIAIELPVVKPPIKNELVKEFVLN